MNASKTEIKSLVEWLEPRLEPLISHGEKVRELLNTANGVEKIIETATQMVVNENATVPDLTPQQMATWKALLPILAEHGLMAVKGGGSPLATDSPMTKEQAAEFLGLGIRKLEMCMKKRQITYEKHGVGRTAMVRFHRADLERYQASRTVPARSIQKL